MNYLQDYLEGDLQEVYYLLHLFQDYFLVPLLQHLIHLSSTPVIKVCLV